MGLDVEQWFTTTAPETTSAPLVFIKSSPKNPMYLQLTNSLYIKHSLYFDLRDLGFDDGFIVAHKSTYLTYEK